jgi:hypothetical protein
MHLQSTTYMNSLKTYEINMFIIIIENIIYE